MITFQKANVTVIVTVTVSLNYDNFDFMKPVSVPPKHLPRTDGEQYCTLCFQWELSVCLRAHGLIVHQYLTVPRSTVTGTAQYFNV